MSTRVGEILTDIIQTIRSTNAFPAVTLGPDHDAARWPRAEVMLVTIDQARPDDRPEGRWYALKAKVYVHVRSTEKSSALERALGLAETAQDAILADRFRGQRCRDLPIGKATELGPTRVEPIVKSPYMTVGFDVRCHFESQEEQ